jgi:hypothetical protein
MGYFSQLQSRLYLITAPELDIQFHCEVYRMKSQRGSSDLPRLYFKSGKEIVWDYPRDFETEYYPYTPEATRINNIVGDYLQAAPSTIQTYSHPEDKYGLVDLLKVIDRRVGKRRLTKMKTEVKRWNALQLLKNRLSQ